MFAMNKSEVVLTRWADVAVVLPGSGSDAMFARQAYGPALAAAGTDVRAVEPNPAGVVESYRAALDAAWLEHGPIIVGGISIGAAVALAWAGEHPDRTVGVLAALPPWLGDASGAPAAQSAALTAHRLRTEGLSSVTEAMRTSSPRWLADTLSRSWASQWPHLPDALDEAAAYHAPDAPSLRRVTSPTAVVGATDDAVHPFDVAKVWRREIPRSALAAVSLDDIGADPSIIGHRAVAGLHELLR